MILDRFGRNSVLDRWNGTSETESLTNSHFPAPPSSSSSAVSRQPILGRRLVLLTVLLGGFTAFGPLSMDLYLPAFPQLADDLGASQAAVQLTLTGDVIGIVIGQLVLGPMSDAWGRRRLLIGSTLVCAVASVLCALSPSATLLVMLAVTGSWLPMFYLLAVISLVLAAVSWKVIPETLAPEKRHPGGLRQTGRAFAGLARDRIFAGYACSAAESWSPRSLHLAARAPRCRLPPWSPVARLPHCWPPHSSPAVLARRPADARFAASSSTAYSPESTRTVPAQVMSSTIQPCCRILKRFVHPLT
jgi:MFS family permease